GMITKAIHMACQNQFTMLELL
ncbi:MAG: hypothetical protein JWN96_1041, partial [Mycobacterium sp.]|nr:hypothetical protein [Mycobacterium sp.]